MYACRAQVRQQHSGGKQVGAEKKKAEGSGASSFNGVRAVPGVDGGTVYAAFLGMLAQLHLCFGCELHRVNLLSYDYLSLVESHLWQHKLPSCFCACCHAFLYGLEEVIQDSLAHIVLKFMEIARLLLHSACHELA